MLEKGGKDEKDEKDEKVVEEHGESEELDDHEKQQIQEIERGRELCMIRSSDPVGSVDLSTSSCALSMSRHSRESAHLHSLG